MAVSCALVAGGFAAPQRAPRPRPVVRVPSRRTGGGVYPLGDGLVSAFGRLLPDITVEHHPSTGAVNNAELIQSGNADLGFVFADVAYVAYVAGLERKELERKEVFDRLRGVAVLELTPLHLVVRAGITSVRDLRGRRVALGPPGSGTALTAEIVLRAFGIRLADIHTEALQFDDAARRLAAGQLDAMFDTAIYPVEAVKMAAAAGARLMPLTGSPIDKLRLEYPFFRAAAIPRDAYRGMTEAVHTIGVDSLLVCRRDLDEELVYQLTRRFFDALPMLSSSQNALRLMDLDQAPATPIPLHDGAARYYRERELLR